jgi:hypothetical protein
LRHGKCRYPFARFAPELLLPLRRTGHFHAYARRYGDDSQAYRQRKHLGSCPFPDLGHACNAASRVPTEISGDPFPSRMNAKIAFQADHHRMRGDGSRRARVVIARTASAEFGNDLKEP